MSHYQNTSYAHQYGTSTQPAKTNPFDDNDAFADLANPFEYFFFQDNQQQQQQQQQYQNQYQPSQQQQQQQPQPQQYQQQQYQPQQQYQQQHANQQYNKPVQNNNNFYNVMQGTQAPLRTSPPATRSGSIPPPQSRAPPPQRTAPVEQRQPAEEKLTSDQLFPMREMMNRKNDYELNKGKTGALGPVSSLFPEKIQHQNDPFDNSTMMDSIDQIAAQQEYQYQQEYAAQQQRAYEEEQQRLYEQQQRAYEEQQRLAKERQRQEAIERERQRREAQERELQRKEAQERERARLEAQERERQRQEAERQRQEAERQRQAALERQIQEIERQQQLEAERQRQQEMERQRQMQLERQRRAEEERQRLEALEAERQRQEAIDRRNQELAEQRERMMMERNRARLQQEREDRELALRMQREDEENERERQRKLADDIERENSMAKKNAVNTKDTKKKTVEASKRLHFKINHEDTIMTSLQIGSTVNLEVLNDSKEALYVVKMRIGGTTTIWDKDDRPLYKITNEDGHFHKTYAIWSSRGQIGLCKERFKPLTKDRKFNYKRSDNAQVLKMVGKYGGDFVVKKNHKIVGTVEAQLPDGYDLIVATQNSDMIHLVAHSLIMMQRMFIKEDVTPYLNSH